MWPFNRRKNIQQKGTQSVDDRGWTRIFDWAPGAWQTHHPYDTEQSVLAYPTVFACSTLIQSDIGKLRPLIQRKQDGIWVDAGSDLSRLLRRPNRYQNHIQFKENWLNSKLSHGNTYVLKVRRNGKIDELQILDPLKVTPLEADNGDVFYRLQGDRLSGVPDGDITVPSTEIIHDRFNCLFHPLVGLSPIFAAGTAATTGLTIQKNSKHFFANGSNPSGVLTAPGAISDSTAARLKEYFEDGFSGKKSGRVAVAGDGLKYEPMRMSNVDAQVIEQMGWNDEKICSVYHVPAYKVGVGAMPTHNNIEALTQDYYTQCLQILIESMETCLDDGLDIPDGYRTQLDLDGLFRMDTKTQIEMLAKGVEKALYSPDEGRQRLNLPPVPGGEYPYLQQQNYSLAALAERDAGDPFENETIPEPEATDEQIEEQSRMLALLIEKELRTDAA